MLSYMPVRAIGINHVAFEVADIDETLAWYERWFAFTLRGRGRQMAFIDLGDQFIALMQADVDGPHLDRTRHHGIVVDDKEALRAELLGAGVDVAPSGSLRIHDPSGNQLEIVDYRDVQFSKTGAVLGAIGLDGLHKSESARRELADKGMLGD
jgi:catechol 2,3-dioxygenase-like lactoylglutathione lyase family enzyme